TPCAAPAGSGGRSLSDRLRLPPPLVQPVPRPGGQVAVLLPVARRPRHAHQLGPLRPVQADQQPALARRQVTAAAVDPLRLPPPDTSWDRAWPSPRKNWAVCRNAPPSIFSELRSTWPLATATSRTPSRSASNSTVPKPRNGTLAGPSRDVCVPSPNVSLPRLR